MRKMCFLIKKFFRLYFLKIELILSLLIISLITYLIYRYLGFDILQSKLNNLRSSIYGTLISLSGALLGFVITGLSILLTTSSNPSMERLRKSKHYKTIFRIFFSTSKYLGLLLGLSILSLVFDTDENPTVFLSLITLWALIISTFRILRCLWVLEKVASIHILKT